MASENETSDHVTTVTFSFPADLKIEINDCEPTAQQEIINQDSYVKTEISDYATCVIGSFLEGGSASIKTETSHTDSTSVSSPSEGLSPNLTTFVGTSLEGLLSNIQTASSSTLGESFNLGGTMVKATLSAPKTDQKVKERNKTQPENKTKHQRKEKTIKCSKIFSTQNGLRIHIAGHIDEEQFECEQCSKKFRTLTQLKVHIKSRKETKSFKCDLCGTRFHTQSQLTRHLATYHGEESIFKCKQCPKSFKMKRFLAQHLLSHKPIQPIQCTQCPKSYFSKSYFTEHLKSHARGRIVKCKLCHESRPCVRHQSLGKINDPQTEMTVKQK